MIRYLRNRTLGFGLFRWGREIRVGCPRIGKRAACEWFPLPWHGFVVIPNRRFGLYAHPTVGDAATFGHSEP